MKEKVAEDRIRKYLKDKGGRLKKEQKKQGEHGVDIEASHPNKWPPTFKNKIKKMTYGWKLLRLKGFLV
ncbi:MAG: hypothetical protein ABH815_00195 [Candidatus Omnitrophota bacterium]